MWFSSIRPVDSALLLSLLLLSPLPTSAMLRCDHIRVDGASFDLSKLGGPHSVVTSIEEPPSFKNTTYTLDICKPLKRKFDVPKGEECPNGSQVCAIEHTIRPDRKDGDEISKVIPIAGDLKNYGGGDLDHELTRLKTSDSHADAQKEGVRLVLKGGIYNKRRQKAIIELLCNPDLEGSEGEYDPEDKYESNGAPSGPNADKSRKREGEEGDKDGDVPTGLIQLGPKNQSLVFNSYGFEANDQKTEVLRLTWHTKYACENRRGKGDNGEDVQGNHWGFFTWMVILVFLATASYLIFGSWLNYNRYGARGWDLLPHGDTIRDIPYLLKDWARRVLNTVQGSGSRGGYSAV